VFKVFRLVGMPTGITSNSLLLLPKLKMTKNVCENFTFGGLCPINSHHILTVLTWCFDTFVKTIDMPKSLDKLHTT
jgi:hypothetical protein